MPEELVHHDRDGNEMQVTCYVNFDSSSELATKNKIGALGLQGPYLGEAIMDAMDFAPARHEIDDDDLDPNREMGDLPEIEDIVFEKITLDHITDGETIDRMPIDSPPLKAMAQSLAEVGVSVSEWKEQIDDPEIFEKVRNSFKRHMQAEQTEFDERGKIEQWRELVDRAVGKLAAETTRKLSAGGRFEKSLIGDVKKRLNRQKMVDCGGVANDIDVLKRHYQWCINLQANIKETGMPPWLM